ncbi:hypothetical protein LZ554_000457 [Drepanopeziza brunnea f. sp. 'monogermtubi']|nr:hypothetical protein LZ554_000457 [Drepanopeziza brunnea f. sp. 'monogermtubi']
MFEYFTFGAHPQTRFFEARGPNDNDDNDDGCASPTDTSFSLPPPKPSSRGIGVSIIRMQHRVQHQSQLLHRFEPFDRLRGGGTFFLQVSAAVGSLAGGWF